VCGKITRRVHSRYSRTLSDLPWHGNAVRIQLEARRFFCDTASCSRRIFAERLPETTKHYARRTLRLSAAIDAVALALGGEAGARLAGRLAMRISPGTMLRRLHGGAPASPATAPRVLGVDDWAFRKGQRYGTILVDLERRRPVDLLPDRTADTLARWLAKHSGIGIIARDRSSEYSRAIQQAAPHVREVADRWHLLHNLRQMLERFFTGHHAHLKQLVGDEVARLPPSFEWTPQRRSRAEEAASAAGSGASLVTTKCVDSTLMKG
jgi:transposase